MIKHTKTATCNCMSDVGVYKIFCHTLNKPSKPDSHARLDIAVQILAPYTIQLN